MGFFSVFILFWSSKIKCFEVIKNVKESLLIQYLERHYELQPVSSKDETVKGRVLNCLEKLSRRYELQPVSSKDEAERLRVLNYIRHPRPIEAY